MSVLYKSSPRHVQSLVHIQMGMYAYSDMVPFCSHTGMPHFAVLIRKQDKGNG